MPCNDKGPLQAFHFLDPRCGDLLRCQVTSVRFIPSVGRSCLFHSLFKIYEFLLKFLSNIRETYNMMILINTNVLYFSVNSSSGRCFMSSLTALEYLGPDWPWQLASFTVFSKERKDITTNQ